MKPSAPNSGFMRAALQPELCPHQEMIQRAMGGFERRGRNWVKAGFKPQKRSLRYAFKKMKRMEIFAKIK